MGMKHDIRRAQTYIARADRRAVKHRALIGNCRDPQTIATLRDLIEVLSALRTNVEHKLDEWKSHKTGRLKRGGSALPRG